MKTIFSVRVSSFQAVVALFGVAAMHGQTSRSQKTLTGVGRFDVRC